MSINQETQDMLDSLYLDLLSFGGVENWEWYSESLSDVPDDADNYTVIAALQAGGVDNWEWYDEALGEFSYYSDHVKERPTDYLSYEDWVDAVERAEAEDAAVKAKSTEEEKPEPELSVQNQALLNYIKKNSNESESQRIYESIVEIFWKRNTSPKDFDKALKNAEPGQGYLLSASMNYLELMIKNKKLDKMINEAK